MTTRICKGLGTDRNWDVFVLAVFFLYWFEKLAWGWGGGFV